MSDAGAIAVATRPAPGRRLRATAALYDAHGRQAYRLALALLADEAAAADAVAEAFGSLCRRSRLRREPRTRQRTLLLRAVYRAAAAHDRGTLLSGLPPEEREALLLCVHGVSCAELAATGRTSKAEVAAQVSRALRRVRDAPGTGPAEAVA